MDETHQSDMSYYSAKEAGPIYFIQIYGTRYLLIFLGESDPYNLVSLSPPIQNTGCPKSHISDNFSKTTFKGARLLSIVGQACPVRGGRSLNPQ